jgi:hypothetical protein
VVTFSRDEIELLKDDDPHYIEEMKRAPWWPETTEEREKTLAEQDRPEAGHGEGRDLE